MRESPSIQISTSLTETDIDLSQSDIINSTLRGSKYISTSATTTNPTGLAVYMSSDSEDTSLMHEDSLSSISTLNNMINSSEDFPVQKWGYQLNESGAYLPIPKLSSPDLIDKTDHAGSYELKGVTFYIKTSPSLPAGKYSRKIIFTAITNYVPKIATFLPGGIFNNSIMHDLMHHGDIAKFEHSITAPADLTSAKVVSTLDSDYPIYAWFDSSTKTIHWWSEADITYANEDSSNMFNYESITNQDYVVDVEGIDTSKTVDMSNMFSCGKVGSIKEIRNLNKFNTSKVERMSGMFNCLSPNSHIQTLDVSKFNTGKVKDMTRMFNGQRGLKSLDLSIFDTTQVTSMENMFSKNEEITNLDLSNFDTGNVTNMSGMFSYMTKLERLKISNFDTGNVISMHEMFAHSPSLEELNISNFNTSKVQDMSGMFQLSAIKKLDLSNFNTSEVGNMEYMFDNMSYLEELNISNFNTLKVSKMSAMFRRLLVLKNLDISSFDTSNVVHMWEMFYECKMLSKIEASDLFTTNKVNDFGQDMFQWSTQLVGGNGTVYNPLKVNKEYARIDKPGKPGYFTQKP